MSRSSRSGARSEAPPRSPLAPLSMRRSSSSRPHAEVRPRQHPAPGGYAHPAAAAAASAEHLARSVRPAHVVCTCRPQVFEGVASRSWRMRRRWRTSQWLLRTSDMNDEDGRSMQVSQSSFVGDSASSSGVVKMSASAECLTPPPSDASPRASPSNESYTYSQPALCTRDPCPPFAHICAHRARIPPSPPPLLLIGLV